MFVGPQFFLAFAWVPVARTITDMPTRLRLTRTLTRRFAYLGGAGLVLIVVAGSYLISTWRNFYAQPDDLGFTDIRYGVLFIVKMTIFIVMLAVLALHTFSVGPKLIDQMEAQAAGKATEADVRRARGMSMGLSIGGLALALVLMILGVMMNTTEFSFQSS